MKLSDLPEPSKDLLVIETTLSYFYEVPMEKKHRYPILAPWRPEQKLVAKIPKNYAKNPDYRYCYLKYYYEGNSDYMDARLISHKIIKGCT